ncbi:MAG: hypothetical protein Q9162_003200 [Coniocarpon cinnabarinum]
MPLNSQQKSAVSQFANVTDADKKTAEKFDRYRDDPKSEPDLIRIGGAQKYLTDLHVSLDQFEVLLLHTLLGSPTLGTFERAKFTSGWAQHGASTAQQQQNTIARLTGAVNSSNAAATLPGPIVDVTGGSNHGSETLFKRVYRHTFQLALPTEPANARSVPLEMASEFWRLLLGQNSPGLVWAGKKNKTSWLDWWIDFLNERGGKAVSRDLWVQTLEFARQSSEDEALSFWSEDAAWPGMIDEYVGWVKEKREKEGKMDVS